MDRTKDNGKTGKKEKGHHHVIILFLLQFEIKRLNRNNCADRDVDDNQ